MLRVSVVSCFTVPVLLRICMALWYPFCVDSVLCSALFMSDNWLGIVLYPPFFVCIGVVFCYVLPVGGGGGGGDGGRKDGCQSHAQEGGRLYRVVEHFTVHPAPPRPLIVTCPRFFTPGLAIFSLPSHFPLPNSLSFPLCSPFPLFHFFFPPFAIISLFHPIFPLDPMSFQVQYLLYGPPLTFPSIFLPFLTSTSLSRVIPPFLVTPVFLYLPPHQHHHHRRRPRPYLISHSISLLIHPSAKSPPSVVGQEPYWVVEVTY